MPTMLYLFFQTCSNFIQMCVRKGYCHGYPNCFYPFLWCDDIIEVRLHSTTWKDLFDRLDWQRRGYLGAGQACPGGNSVRAFSGLFKFSWAVSCCVASDFVQTCPSPFQLKRLFAPWICQRKIRIATDELWYFDTYLSCCRKVLRILCSETFAQRWVLKESWRTCGHDILLKTWKEDKAQSYW